MVWQQVARHVKEDPTEELAVHSADRDDGVLWIASEEVNMTTVPVKGRPARLCEWVLRMLV